MPKKRYILIFLGSVLIFLVFLRGYFNKINQAPSFPLEDIKLGKINRQSKEVLDTNAFLKNDEFLISLRNTEQKLALKIILVDYQALVETLLSDTMVQPGDNEICCFEAPKTAARYDLKFIVGQKEKTIPFEVKSRLVEYRDYNLRGVAVISYPRWQFLDAGVINNLLTNVYSYYSKDLARGVSTLLVAQDENGAKFAITQRKISNLKEDLLSYFTPNHNAPFGNLVQTIAENENKALLKAGIIDDYTILDKQYGEKEIDLKIRNISRGVSYLVFNKTFLEKNFLNQKFLISVSLTCPERLLDFYQPVVDHIFSHIKLPPSS